jgi:ABC-type transporter Mla MlaB component
VASRRSKTFSVELSGDLTIRSINEIRTRMNDALRDHADVTADIADDAAVDLTFVQLLESARRSARETGKAFALAGPATGALKETLERGGFLAGDDRSRREFWLMGSGDL